MIVFVYHTIKIRLSLILPQNAQVSVQYLKFDKTYASANTCTCSRFRDFFIRKRAEPFAESTEQKRKRYLKNVVIY